MKKSNHKKPIEVTVPLTDREWNKLCRYAKAKDIPPEKVMLLALRVFDVVEEYHKQGAAMAFHHPDKGFFLPGFNCGCGGELKMEDESQIQPK